MKSLFTIVKFTAKEYIKKKSFIVVNAIMLLIIVALCNVPNLINAFGSGEDDDKLKVQVNSHVNYTHGLNKEDDDKLKVQVIDNENILNASSEIFNEIGLDYDIEYFNNKFFFLPKYSPVTITKRSCSIWPWLALR